jgi:ubiquinone/menaquinone biosynthesis C-methylase UbiE
LFVLFLLCSLSLISFQSTDSRDRRHQPDKVMDTAGVKPGMIIGEVGAGYGYFTFKLAERVGESGKIYANDIAAGALRGLQRRCEREEITNIETILGKVDDPLLPQGELDMVFIVNAFHDFEKPVALLNNLAVSLKPKATVVILDRDPAKFSDPSGHFLTKEEVLQRIKESVFELVRIETFLTQHNIYIIRLE